MSELRVIPAIRYRDARAAIDWLCTAFGFEKRLIVPGPEATIAHAQLSCRGGMVMVSSTRADPFGQLLVTPADAGGVTNCTYVVVDDLDVHHQRALDAGAEVVVPLLVEPHGRSYMCRDPEGHLWSFGDYDPWADRSPSN